MVWTVDIKSQGAQKRDEPSESFHVAQNDWAPISGYWMSASQSTDLALSRGSSWAEICTSPPVLKGELSRAHNIHSCWAQPEAGVVAAILTGWTKKRGWKRVRVWVGGCLHSDMSDSGGPWTTAHRAPPSTEFSRQGYWSGLPFPLWKPHVKQKDRRILGHWWYCGAISSTQGWPSLVLLLCLKNNFLFA